jgi:anaerobic magnesium-protoporphyrin IX monomethyl ester cyclase
MAQVLLINPNQDKIYSNSPVNDFVPHYAPLGLLSIAGPLKSDGHDVTLLDLSVNPGQLGSVLKGKKPELVGITFTTPLYKEACRLAEAVRKHHQDVLIVAGGPHVSAEPEQILKDSEFDVSVIGEGDYTFRDLLVKKRVGEVEGIAYKSGRRVVVNKRRLPVMLDELPFTPWDLTHPADYVVPHPFARRNPVGVMETSRGCVFGCTFCSRAVFGRSFRAKSPMRVVAELRSMLANGFKEIHIMDDGFTTDISRAKRICRLMIEEDVEAPINCPNGIRADRINLELLRLMRKAGFYRVAFGVETGSQRLLNTVCKGLKKDNIRKAFRLCRETGIETVGYFMFGLPGEKESDMQKTIDFAKELGPDFVKFDLTTPFPGSQIYQQLDEKGDWDSYTHYGERGGKETQLAYRYLRKAYNEFYRSPGYMARRVYRSLMKGEILKDLTIAAKAWRSTSG